MKRAFFSAFVITAIVFAACNNGKDKSSDHNMADMKDSTSASTSTDDKEVKTLTSKYSNLDPQVSASVKEIFDHYIHIKNALVEGNSSEAANGAKAMERAITKVDKSLFTAQQKSEYDEVSDDLKEHAEHVGKSELAHQRAHFATMSEDVYALAKAFGTGSALYHYHCPMYNNNKGAMWLSESKEIKNPYYGSEMLTCGKMEEIIK
jgi:hypothetical protein